MLAKKIYEYRGVIIFYLLLFLMFLAMSYQVQVLDKQSYEASIKSID